MGARWHCPKDGNGVVRRGSFHRHGYGSRDPGTAPGLLRSCWALAASCSRHTCAIAGPARIPHNPSAASGCGVTWLALDPGFGADSISYTAAPRFASPGLPDYASSDLATKMCEKHGLAPGLNRERRSRSNGQRGRIVVFQGRPAPRQSRASAAHGIPFMI